MPLTVLNVSYPLARVRQDAAGGAEQVLATLDEALVRRGHNSLVIAPYGSECRGLLLPTIASDGVLDDHAKKLAHLRHREAIAHTLANYSVDVVHLHGIDFLDYIPDTDVPVTVSLHLPSAWYPPSAFEGRPQTHLICVSRSQAKSCPAHARIHRVIENGVRPPLPGIPKRQHERPYVLSMGRICPEKGFHLAMDAATICGIRFLLAGAVFEYPEHREYFAREIEPRLDRNHRFIGAVGAARKQQLLTDATCLLIPSLVAETSSLVAMEAMACGTPVIAFRAGALCEIIDHGRTGFLVDSAEEMAHAISEVASIDAEVCRREARSRFSADRMAEEYLDLYRHLAARRTTDQVGALN